MNDGGLTVIEWSQFVPDLIPDEWLKISIELMDEDKRKFLFLANGNRYEKLLEALI